MYLKYIVTLFLLSFCISIKAQDDILSYSKHRIGIISGFGNQNGLGLKYQYDVRFFQLQYFNKLTKRTKWQLDLLIQPQYNTTTLRPVDFEPNEITGYEYGINIGLLYRRTPINKPFSYYALLSLGPHYVSDTPERQIEGYIFSDNFAIGSTLKLSQLIHFELRLGFRHISNANFRLPNGGINNLFYSGGLMVNL